MTNVGQVDPKAAEFLSWMSNHLVALVANVAVLNGDGSVKEQRFVWYSGFIIQLHGQHFWVTAGHCIENFEDEYLNNPGVHVSGISFMYCFGSDASHREALPFHYDAGDAMKLYQRDPDLDFAIVPLNDFACRGLATNGIKAVTREMWQDRPDHDYFEYKVIGLPAHFVEQMTDKPSWGLRPTGVGVDRLRPSEVADCPYDNWFVGKIRADAGAMKSVVGMSGGPIFAFWKDAAGERHYDIIAVQSSWFENRRIIFGCPLDSFAEVLHQVIEHAKAEKE